ncbi:hypothetical protein Cgig2_033298 [Carnegiea gigantea]|uniref:C2H2-type domain-containing protein n=1 Tax=Carnegiea gigantea TaxID=171969 RepID=A0A9Q1QQ65_9CARY|nr:hypothetical protein Cgig2_033298 [Carnegiea gigantea]
MYALRTNPNRLRNCRVCEHCGKEFESWKSFLEHGKCDISDDGESLVSSPGLDDDGEDGNNERKRCGWAKRKRSFRADSATMTTAGVDPTLTARPFKTNIVRNSDTTTSPSSEEEDLANCLIMLSNATVYPYLVGDQPAESSASASKEEERRIPISYNITPIMARLPPLDNKATKGVAASGNVPRGMFECKACKKVFNSHQALGGHRASHKKVKGCFAARLDRVNRDNEHHNMFASDQEVTKPSHLTCATLQADQRASNINIPPSMPMSKRKSRVHECSICHRVFSSGQALGGHKRCHWISSNTPDPSTLVRFQDLQAEQIERVQEVPTMLAAHSKKAWDLNMPAPNDQNNMVGIRRDPKNPLSFEVSTDIFLQSWGGINIQPKHEHHQHQQKQGEDNDNGQDNNGGKKISNKNGAFKPNVPDNADDEADSKVKLAKLCMKLKTSAISSKRHCFGSSSVSVTKDPERETEFVSEFESESSKQHNSPTKKRSRRQRQRKQKQPPIETTSSLSLSPESSVSEVTSEEDVALCLMMLSRDNWKCSAPKKDDGFTCLTCHKVFRSYQALGGHRASHKKIRPENHPRHDSKPGPGSDPSEQRKTHDCPVCFRVFASAQALGGHKRTHSSTSSAAAGGGGSGGIRGGASESNGVGESPEKKMNAFIDLNLPAPVDDHDDEISQVSLSAVSDPHFS